MPENEENAIQDSFDDFFLERMRQNGKFVSGSLSEQEIDASVIGLVPMQIASKYRLVPFSCQNGVISVATDSAQTLKNLGHLQKRLGKQIDVHFAQGDSIKDALDKYYGISIYSNVGLGTSNDIDADSTPLKRKINEMIQYAAELEANDIHLLPYNRGVYVWFRINGHPVDFTDFYHFTPEDGVPIVNIVKGMDTSGNADSTDSNMPNRGSFMTRHGDVLIDCRISTVPVGSETGRQKADIRLMPQKRDLVKLENIYVGEDLENIKKALRRSASGLFLNSGPVGSGKTTSLYAQINYLWELGKEPQVVFCIENPIEIKEERYVQVQVREAANEAVSLTAPKILKVALRSDPDIILYGEVRDAGDAMVAVTASQTGHPVFSTVHASDCVRTISRLLDLDIPKMSLLSELRMILSQRLVGILCPSCSRPHVLTDDEKQILSREEIEFLTSPGAKLMERGSPEDWKNCPRHCSYGLAERTAVTEYILFDDDLRDALLYQHGFREIHETLKNHGYERMWDKALRLCRQGFIELSDMISIIGKE